MALPLKKIFFSLLDENVKLPEDFQNIVVVSFFGKTSFFSSGCKFDPFQTYIPNTVNVSGFPDIDALYDPAQRVLYLQLRDILDVNNLMQTLNANPNDIYKYGYLTAWADLKMSYARILFVLFSISHIMVLSHPVARFDLSYLNMFRGVELLRKELKSDVVKILSEIQPEVSKEWLETARLCPPRILFHFFNGPNKSVDSKLERALEDQIYRILKRQRIVSNASANTLFAVPANNEFVFIEPKVADKAGGHLFESVKQIVDQCRNPFELEEIKFDMLTIQSQLDDYENSRTFESFLKSHVRTALTSGLDDNIGRHLSPAPFTLPTFTQVIVAAKALYHLLTSSSQTPRLSLHLHILDTDRQFSEARCAKVLPLALAAYQENLPPHYPRQYHENRLAGALAVLESNGRGAMMEKYVEELEKACRIYWQDGRQMCEVLSLTGHPCTNGMHRGGGEGAGGGEGREDKSFESLPEKEHCSGVRYIATCNCGRKQTTRSDPYTLRAANYEFYKSLAAECGCDKLECYKFPVFQPSIKDFRAAQLGRRESLGLALLRGDFVRSQLNVPTQHEGLSLASGISLHGSDNETRLSCLRTQHPDIVILTNQLVETKDKGLVRQASTTEYLPGMLHTESPTGLLPQFSSWSLICVGASSIYSHNLGLTDQPGLITGSSYLLPWDVTVRLEHHRKNAWPSVADSKKMSVQARARKNKGEQSEMVVKVFLGVEYECPRGHRFMAAASDKVLKTGPSGQVRDTGHKVATADMPLYFPCPCSKPSKPMVSQLMRVHIVTPKAPVRVTLNPKVQPAPNAPLFIACGDQPIALSQSAYWVLRLPYVYMNERSPFIAPLEGPPPNYGRLLAGCYGIAEIPPEAAT